MFTYQNMWMVVHYNTYVFRYPNTWMLLTIIRTCLLTKIRGKGLGVQCCAHQYDLEVAVGVFVEQILELHQQKVRADITLVHLIDNDVRGVGQQRIVLQPRTITSNTTVHTHSHQTLQYTLTPTHPRTSTPTHQHTHTHLHKPM